jgi:pyrroloquinoline quinone (PQQ) biosynthesis protein C
MDKRVRYDTSTLGNEYEEILMSKLLPPEELIADLQHTLQQRHPRPHPIPELRRMLLENMVEEEGEDLFGGKYPSHRELWMKFAVGIGISQEEILNYEPLPGIRAALEMYVSLVQQSHWAVAIGTGLVFEGGGPKRMKEEREALEKYYSWIPSDSLDFFRAHEYHDEGHGNMVIDVIKQHCMVEHLQNEMRNAVEQRADIMWLQNDCIYNAFVRPSLPMKTIQEIEGRLE